MALWISLMLASCGGRAGNAVLQAEKGGGPGNKLSNKQNRQKRLRAGWVQRLHPARFDSRQKGDRMAHEKSGEAGQMVKKQNA